MTHVNLYNAERYLDPTAYEALMNIEREAKRTAYKPLVFICSPFAGNIERNTRRAREFCRFAVSENCIPIAPNDFFYSGIYLYIITHICFTAQKLLWKHLG